MYIFNDYNHLYPVYHNKTKTYVLFIRMSLFMSYSTDPQGGYKIQMNYRIVTFPYFEP